MSLSPIKIQLIKILLRLKATRFANAVVSFSSMLEKKKDMRQMFACGEWKGSNHSEINASKKVHIWKPIHIITQ